MKICPKCDISHICKGKFCSRKCANSRVFSEESKQKKREASQRYIQTLSPEVLKVRMRTMSNAKIAKAVKRLTTAPFNTLGFDRQRLRVFLEQEQKCLQCELQQWMGETISLELDHIDGNRQNNSRDNLRGLCPNCHSLTPTWRGRNKENKREKNVTDDEFINALITTKNIRQALLTLHLAPKGGHYTRAYRLLDIIGERGGTRTHGVLSQED